MPIAGSPRSHNRASNKTNNGRSKEDGENIGACRSSGEAKGREKEEKGDTEPGEAKG